MKSSTSAIIVLLVLIWGGAAAKVNAIIERSDTEYIVSSRTSMTTREVSRIRVLNQDGYDYAVYVGYYDKYRKVKSLIMVVYDVNNKKVKRLTKADAADVMYNDAQSIDDTRRVILDPQYQSYPFTVEIEAEYVNNGFIGLPPWYPVAGTSAEVKSATLTFRCPLEYEYRAKEYNGVPAAAVTTTENQKVLTWKMSELGALNSYSNSKIFTISTPRVDIAPVSFSFADTEGNFKSWLDFGEWFLKINSGRNALSAETKKALEQIKAKNKGDVKSTVADVYRFMQGRTRYISIQLGIGGYQTIPADVVDKNGYGDCKALSNYTKAMLEYVGIPSNYILVRAGAEQPDVLDIPMNQFNHVFLAVPDKGDTLWLECTDQLDPPFYQGTHTDDRNVLWITEKGSKLVRTPAYPANDNVMRKKAVVNVSQTGDAVARIQWERTGMFFTVYGLYENATRDKLDRYNISRFSYKDFTIPSWTWKVPDRSIPVLKEEMEIKVLRLGQIVQEKILIPFNPLTPVDKSFDMDQANKVVDVSRAFTLEDHIEIVLPDSFYSDFVPAAFKEKNEFGEIEMTATTNDAHNLVIYKKAVFNKGTYKAEQYDRFAAFLKKIRQAEQSRIVYKGRT